MSQKLARLMANDLLDHHAIEHQKFEAKLITCRPMQSIREVVFVLSNYATEKGVEIKQSIGRLLYRRMKADVQRIQ